MFETDTSFLRLVVVPVRRYFYNSVLSLQIEHEQPSQNADLARSGVTPLPFDA